MLDNDGQLSPNRERRTGAGELDCYVPSSPRGEAAEDSDAGEDDSADAGKGPHTEVLLQHNDAIGSDDDASEAQPAACTILPSRLIYPITREPPTNPKQFLLPRTVPNGTPLVQVFEFRDIYVWIGHSVLASRNERWDVGHPTEPGEKCPCFFALRHIRNPPPGDIQRIRDERIRLGLSLEKKTPSEEQRDEFT